MAIASAAGLEADSASVLNDSNRLAVRLMPCDVVARVAHVAHQAARLEVDLAQRLAGAECPVAGLDPRAVPRVYERDGFTVTLWTYYEQMTSEKTSRADYATALMRLHEGLRTFDVSVPHFTDRVAEAQELVASRDCTPTLADADRDLLARSLRECSRLIGEHDHVEQLLHGEPHAGNLLGATGRSDGWRRAPRVPTAWPPTTGCGRSTRWATPSDGLTTRLCAFSMTSFNHLTPIR